MTIPSRPTRTSLLVSALAALLLAACGSEGGGSDATASAEEAAQASDAGEKGVQDGAFPVEIEHKFGTTEIPEEPERVVALGYTELDYALALGVEPVGARYPQFGPESTAVRPWAVEAAGDADIEVLNMAYGELGFEAIAALEPDLILGVTAGLTEDEYATLSDIAPTVAQTDEFVDFGTPWQDTTLLIGQALGAEPEAEALVADLEARFEEVRDAHPEWDGLSLASAYYGGDEVLFFASEDLRARFFTDLGFAIPAELDELADGAFFGSVSLEQLDLIDRDVLVWSQLQFTEGGREAIEADLIVGGLAATQDGRALFVGGEVDDAFQVSSILSLASALDGIVPMLERATDGDPASEPSPLS